MTADIMDFADREAECTAPRPNGRDLQRQLCALTLPEFLSLDLPPRGLILAPWLPTKGLAMLHAIRGIGKTLLALSTAYAVAIGGSLLGWQVPRPRRVVYIDGEMPAATMQRRLAAIKAAFGAELLAPDYLRLISADMNDGLPDLATAEGQASIDGVIGKAELIIIDNLSCLVRRGKENEAESWSPVQEWCLAHRRDGRSVLLVYHSGKSGQQRGTSRGEDVLDTVISLRRPADYVSEHGARFEVVIDKGRGIFGDAARAFEARYEERDGVAMWTRTEITDAELRRVADAIRDGMSIRETAAELGIHRSKVERLKKRADAEGLLDV
jgi:putative DNA primase/helicase